MSRRPGRHPAPGALGGAGLATAVLALVSMLMACSPAPAPSVLATPTPEPLPTATITSYAIGATAWYAGLVLHVDGATATLDEGIGSVEVALRLENPGTDTATLVAPVLLVALDMTLQPVRETVFPDIPAGGTVGSTVAFAVDRTFRLARAALRIGRPDEHQVVVPLVAGSGKTVTLEPRTLKVGGSGAAGSLVVKLTGGELRADLPDWGLELPGTSLALSVVYDVTFRSSFAGGFPFTGDSVGLRLPDGTTVAARPDGHSAPATVIAAGATTKGLRSRFEVPAPGTGAYALVIRNGSATTTVKFAVK
jgi:hypothetical protein